MGGRAFLRAALRPANILPTTKPFGDQKWSPSRIAARIFPSFILTDSLGMPANPSENEYLRLVPFSAYMKGEDRELSRTTDTFTLKLDI